MAKRRSKEQLKADRIIKAELLKLKNKILDIAIPMSRRRLGRLQDEMNGYVKPDTKLTMYQMWYGADIYPAGKSSGEKNALNIVVKELEPEKTKIIIGNINDVLLAPFKEDNK